MVSKLLQARTASLSASFMLAKGVKLTIELQIRHRLGVKTLVPAKKGSRELPIQYHVW